MKQKIYQVDAFAEKIFSGNPAAVCSLDKWLSDELMQKIAAENNLAETAFFVKQEDRFEIRWFTPKVEVDLCGHATLAAAFILFNIENHDGSIIQFYSPRSGILEVSKMEDLLSLNFPADIFKPIDITTELSSAFDIEPLEAYRGKTDYMLVFKSENDIMQAVPDLQVIESLPARGVIITAAGDHVDFVSRFFAPQSGIDEDPVTGSAHTTLIPYWSKRLSKVNLKAVQLSQRKGFLECRYFNERVEISGKAKLYLSGEIYLEENI